jgi:DNA-directed RNA polymerase subunit RPC12/RpoP
VAKDKQNENIVYETCPHCGQKLSPWQQVLLNVDRALMCKNCWYRILLDTRDEIDDQSVEREER